MRKQLQRHAIRRAVVETLESRRLLSLAAPVSYAVGDSPQTVATGDFNRDGRSDVVTANFTSKNVSVMLATASGAMQPAQHYAAGAALGVAVGDVNNDGKLDIVTPNADAGVSVLLGTGTGTFAAALPVGLPSQFPPGHTGAEPVPQWGVSVAVGDMNVDGKMDLVVGGKTAHLEWFYGYNGPYQMQVITNYVNVLLGNGTAGFATGGSYRYGSNNEAVSVADFNADAKLDVLTGPFGLAVWPGNGNGTLQTPINTGASGYPAVGDFDTDGKLDLAAANPFAGYVGIFKGHGNGSFQHVRDVPVVGAEPGVYHARSIVTGDLDDDGKLDLIVNTQRTVFEAYGYYGGYGPTTTDHTKVLLGFGNGTFSLPISSTLRTYDDFHTGVNATALGDVNADGRRDVISTEPRLDAAMVQLNQGGWVAPVAVEIGDATVTEGHSGTVNAILTVTLDHAVAFAVSVPFSTDDGSATVAGDDYFANSGTLNFSPGQTSKTITVQVRGDRRGEEQETFFVNLGDATNGFATDAQGIVTILEDEPLLSLNSTAMVTEGDSGTKPLVVTATLSLPYDVPVTFDFVPQGGGFAMAGVDFDAAPGTVTFQPGETSRPITLTVRGDTVPEYVESVYVVPSNVSNALWDGSVGHALIIDDDAGAAVVINNVARAEGNSGITPFIFTLTRLTPSERESFVYLSTSSGSASSGGGNQDYEPVSATSAHFAPGQVNAIVVVHVRGDTRSESDETFFVNLTGAEDATIADAQGVGTILNDETRGKTWVGPSEGGNWATASNWSPSGVPTATSLVTIRNASVTLSSSATVAELSLGGGSARLTIAPNGNRVLRTGALFIENGGGSDVGILDLSDNDLIVDYAGAAGSPLGAWNRTGFGIGGAGAPGWYDGILGAVAQGYNRGDWTGAGIVTTRPDALGGLTTLGVGEASDILGISGAQTASFAGQTVDSTTILVKYTYGGDLDLDGDIDGDDYFIIDAHVAQSRLAFAYGVGDIELDGDIDGDDYFWMDSNIAAQTISL